MLFSLRSSLGCFVCLSLLGNFAFGFADPPQIDGFKTSVSQNTITFNPLDDRSFKEVSIPRMFNGVRQLSIVQNDQKISGAVQPEIVTWKLSLPAAKAPGKVDRIELELDGVPQWESAAVTAEADGSFRLSACQALTKGSKLRYEPQPHKNTVGYWVDAEDHAWWTIKLDRPGKFNVAVLQGCGAGQGGSQVELSFASEPATETDQANERKTAEGKSILFNVEETGHFQNFHWRHLGEQAFQEPGTYRIELRCKQKAKAAVGDFREIQLIRLP